MHTSPNLRFSVQPGGSLQGRIRVAGDKSVSHRSIMLGAIAEGVTEVTGFLEGEDSLNTLRAFQAMGVEIDGPTDGKVTIRGVGMHGLRPPATALDLGNSGTAIRLLAGLLAGQSFDTVLTGDESLRGRPMGRVMGPLSEMGVHFDAREGGRLPLTLKGPTRLRPIRYELPEQPLRIERFPTPTPARGEI